MPEIQPIVRQIRRVQLRIKLQRAMNNLVFCSVVGGALFVVLMALLKADVIDWSYTQYIWALLAIPAIGLLEGFIRRVSPIEAAQRIDRSNDLKDRLGSAFEFAQSGERTELMTLQIKDAIKLAPGVRTDAAFPFSLPRFLRGAFVTALYVAAVVVVSTWNYGELDLDLSKLRADYKKSVKLTKKTNKKTPKIPESEKKLLDEKIKELKKQLAETKDQELKEILRKQLKILMALKKGKLNQKAAFKMLADLDKKLKEYKEKKSKGLKELKERMARLGKELKKYKKLKELSDALTQKNFKKAAKALEKLNKTAKNDKQRRKLAKMIKDALKRSRTKKDKKIADLKKKINKLKRKMKSKNRLNRKKKRQLAKMNRMKNRLNRMQKQLQRLMREMNMSPQTRKFLQRLTRQMDNPQDMMRRRKNQKPMTKKELQEYAKMMRRMQKMMKQDRTFKLSKARMMDIRDWLRRQQRLTWGKFRKFDKLARGQCKDGKGKKKGKLFVLGKNGKKIMLLSRGRLARRTLLMPTRSDKPGTKSDPNFLGKRTKRLKGKKKESFQPGKHGKGISKTQFVFDAARRGFSSKSYRKVYQNYQGVYEDKMSRQKIPKGYEAYVRRYMELIRPR